MKSTAAIVNAAVAIISGLVVLVGYFVPVLEPVRNLILGWAAVTAGFALLAGVLNLLSVHWARFRTGKTTQSVYSLILFVSFLISLGVTLLSGPTGKWTLWIFNSIQTPVETTLLALLAVTLAAAAIQLIRRRFDIYTGLFVGTALIILLASAPLYGFGDVALLYKLRDWLTQVPAMAGIRGILIGVSLGAIATGLRILMGADRPYGGK